MTSEDILERSREMLKQQIAIVEESRRLRDEMRQKLLDTLNPPKTSVWKEVKRLFFTNF